MANNEWTKDEQDLLVLLAKRGKKQSAIAKELGRSERAVNSQIYRLRQDGVLKHWLDYENAIVLDIETTDFSADIGILLSWAIKLVGGKVISDVITKEELFNGKFDRRICKSLVSELEKADAVITYFGTGFDNVFLRTRCLILGIDFPSYGTIHHYDVYYTARSKLKLHSKRLDSVAKALGCESQKSPVDISVWQRARWGDKNALDYVLEHNELDVLVLEEVYHKLRDFVKVTKKSI